MILLFQLVGYSVMAAKFLRYSLPILVIVDLMAAVGIVAAVTWLSKRMKSELRAVLMPIVYAGLAVVLFAGQLQASPFFSMHRTTLARWLDADGRRFPESSLRLRRPRGRVASCGERPRPERQSPPTCRRSFEFYLAAESTTGSSGEIVIRRRRVQQHD